MKEITENILSIICPVGILLITIIMYQDPKTTNLYLFIVWVLILLHLGLWAYCSEKRNTNPTQQRKE